MRGRRRRRNKSWKKKTVTSLSLKMTNAVDDIFDRCGVGGGRGDAGEGTGRNSIETCRPSLSERVITVCQCGFTS